MHEDDFRSSRTVQIFRDGGYLSADLMFASVGVLWASCRYIAEVKVPNLGDTNEVIEAYVTAGTTIHLCGYLDRLLHRALYCVTDKLIYIQPTAEPPLVQTGDFLGGISAERKSGFLIEQLVSRGHKHYAYRIVDSVKGIRETVCKVRGITLNYRASHMVNFDVIETLVLGSDDTATITVPYRAQYFAEESRR